MRHARQAVAAPRVPGSPLLVLSCLGWLCGLFAAVPAVAHPQYAMATINRYGKLLLLPHGQVRLLYTVMVGDIPAFEARRQADHNGDGRISADEEAALARQVRDQVAAGMDLRLDGQPVHLHFEEPALVLPDAAVAPSSFAVELTAVFSVPPGGQPDHELRYEDRSRLDPVGEVEILLEEGVGVRLLDSKQGQGAFTGEPKPQTRFSFFGPPPTSLADRSVSFRFREGRAGSAGPHPALWLIGVAVAIGGCLLWWMVRRRR